MSAGESRCGLLRSCRLHDHTECLVDSLAHAKPRRKAQRSVADGCFSSAITSTVSLSTSTEGGDFCIFSYSIFTQTAGSFPAGGFPGRGNDRGRTQLSGVSCQWAVGGGRPGRAADGSLRGLVLRERIELARALTLCAADCFRVQAGSRGVTGARS